MKEKWVQINKIQGFEEIKDCYWISNSDEDKIFNENIGRIMKIGVDKSNYKKIRLMTTNGKRTCKIHILKARAFIYGPNPLGATLVRHLDDCKTNNALTNLAWGTRSDNAQDAIRNGNFNYEAVVKNCAKTGAKTGAKNGKKFSKPVQCKETRIIYSSVSEAERCTGILRINIIQCCYGKRQRAGGFHWEFVNKEEI